jgi:hypothetical protein
MAVGIRLDNGEYLSSWFEGVPDFFDIRLSFSEVDLCPCARVFHRWLLPFQPARVRAAGVYLLFKNSGWFRFLTPRFSSRRFLGLAFSDIYIGTTSAGNYYTYKKCSFCAK